jgi:hypothetical protein
MPDTYSPPQHPLKVVSGHEQSQSELNVITGTASGTTYLTGTQRVVRVIPPASGTHTVYLPPLSDWKNGEVEVYQLVSAPGGQVSVKVLETDTDAIGDNLTAANDFARFLNRQGESVRVIAETTT